MINFLAHAGETHSNSTESAIHFLESWYISLPVFILLIIGFAAVIYLVTKRSVAITYLSVVGSLLVFGIFFFDKSPVLSTASITIGLLGSLVCVLAVLANPKQK